MGICKNVLRKIFRRTVDSLVGFDYEVGMRKDRLDAMLFNRGLCDSREQGKRLVLTGEVSVNGHMVDKPAERFGEDARVEIREKPKFVGRGGLKLEGALDEFQVDVEGWVCLDVGASTGGFTDCLLQRGAVRVHAIDVGTNQLVWKLRNDPRVISKEKFNARGLKEEDLGEKVRLAVMDLSFISLTKVLPAVFDVLLEEGEVICLIKPQFELERGEVGAGGIVREEELRARAVQKIEDFAVLEHGREWKGVVAAKISGATGNQEFLGWIGPKKG